MHKERMVSRAEQLGIQDTRFAKLVHPLYFNHNQAVWDQGRFLHLIYRHRRNIPPPPPKSIFYS